MASQSSPESSHPEPAASPSAGMERQPVLAELVGLFFAPRELGLFRETTPEQLPSHARRLLAHEHHMTVTVERHHGCPVDVRVLRTREDGPHYSREILLTRQSDGAVVQFGIVRLDLRVLASEVVHEIRAQQTPLGRILIAHNVLRKVQLTALWEIEPGETLRELLGVAERERVYGRTALIYCDGEPAVELLEIVTPG